MNNLYIEPDWPAPANVIALSTLRADGHSAAPYGSLNLADHVGDDPAAVLANRTLLTRRLPAGVDLNWLTQVHSAGVIQADMAAAGSVADASWSRTRGQACAVLTADCLPVLFCSRRGDVVAAAHAGWRGLLLGILENTVAAMGTAPHELLAWMGPAIGPAAFEVGAEVRSAYLAASGSAQTAQTQACFTVNSANQGHYFADLYSLARLRLNALGMGEVFGGGHCTFTESEHFFSYRRDGQTGRMASVILLQPL